MADSYLIPRCIITHSALTLFPVGRYLGDGGGFFFAVTGEDVHDGGGCVIPSGGPYRLWYVVWLHLCRGRWCVMGVSKVEQAYGRLILTDNSVLNHRLTNHHDKAWKLNYLQLRINSGSLGEPHYTTR